MKRVLFMAMTGLLPIMSATAQTQKNYTLVGADITQLSLDLQEENTVFKININPKAGWFIKDNIAVGAQVLFGYTTQTGSNEVDYGIGPFARYYFGSQATNLARKAKWFGEVDAGINGKNISTGSESSNTNGLGIGFGPGLAYFLTSNIALEALVKYNLTVGFGSSTTNNSFGAGLGFQIYLPGKKLRELSTPKEIVSPQIN